MRISFLFRISSTIIITILLSQLFSGCTPPAEKKSINSRKDSVSEILSKPPSSYSDTLVITSTCAVFYTPDTAQLQKIKSVNNRMIFESLTHDCFYQMKNARTVLKKTWSRVMIIEASKVRYLLFIKTDKSKVSIDLNTKNDICGLFIFNRVKAPELVDMTNLDTALDLYFNH